MTDATARLADDVLALQSAAERLHEDTLARECAPLIPAALTAIEHTLRTLSRTCHAAAHAFVPLGGHGESIAERYGCAAEEWPAARDGRGPSYEQQARVLSSLHDAGAALRAAAERCGQAGSALADTMEPMHAPAAEERQPRTSAAA